MARAEESRGAAAPSDQSRYAEGRPLQPDDLLQDENYPGGLFQNSKFIDFIRDVLGAAAARSAAEKGQEFDKQNEVLQRFPIEFVRIQPGSFIMGCSTGDSKCYPEEHPAHIVWIFESIRNWKVRDDAGAMACSNGNESELVQV